MKIITLSHQTINNPIYTKLAAGAQVESYSGSGAIGECDIFVFDSASCAAAEVNLVIPPLDAGVSVLLLDPTDEHKQALAKRIGFRSHGAGRGYFVAKTTNDDGHERYRIIEARDSKIKISLISQGAQGDSTGLKKVFDPEVEDVEEEGSLSDADVDLYLSALAATPQAAASSPPPSALIWKSWVYSAHHQLNASGGVNSNTGLGPPPSKTLDLYLTYSFEAALNNAPQSGPFQYLGLLLTGIYQNNGLSNTSDTNYGWIIANIVPSFQPSSELFWYSSSPANTNDVTQVTTGSSVNVGFDSNGASAGYTYSNSTTQNITDWYITQQTASQWLYAQNTPFDGSTTSASVASGCVNWYSGHINTSSFPAISTSSLQFAVDAVWKTNSVLTSEVPVTITNHMQADYFMVKEFLGLGTNFVLWTSSTTPTDTFSIDMSVVAG